MYSNTSMSGAFKRNKKKKIQNLFLKKCIATCAQTIAPITAPKMTTTFTYFFFSAEVFQNVIYCSLLSKMNVHKMFHCSAHSWLGIFFFSNFSLNHNHGENPVDRTTKIALGKQNDLRAIHHSQQSLFSCHFASHFVCVTCLPLVSTIISNDSDMTEKNCDEGSC